MHRSSLPCQTRRGGAAWNDGEVQRAARDRHTVKAVSESCVCDVEALAQTRSCS